ncbi:uncharacterized protein F4812DRAFT_455098 [Daldinia caldariorum]|uniref:uncharacterized protein n=1 Tax=Daldinia caldariorum TaxID=326644 RepID=UPI0020075600|nr:uncharacterized protein F4812DRAFT_455098 [Daldinia caldariorum]KAI1470987.1 hypothetical protein F4812DRAFT_455098 [Daldinia caldariorum]
MSSSLHSGSTTDPGRGPTIAGVSWTLTSLCFICVVARLIVRHRRPSKLGMDDFLISVAVVLQVLFMGFVTEALRWGGGMKDEDLTEEQHRYIIKWFWISTTPAILVSIVARISAAMLLIRIFGSREWFKWFLIIFTALQTIAGAMTIITTWTQIQPVEALWNPAVAPTVVRDGTLNDIVINISQSLFAFSDLSYVFFPIFIIWKLNMPSRRKIGLAILMSLSLISFVGSVMKPVTTAVAKTQYSSSLVILWSAIEQTLIIIISCVPALRSVVLGEIPVVRTISNSVVRLLTFERSRKGSTSSSGSQYRNLEAGPHTPFPYRSDDVTHTALASSDPIHSTDEEQEVEMSSQVQHRDDFVVTYKPASGVMKSG